MRTGPGPRGRRPRAGGAARVAETALAGGQLPQVAVVEDDDLVREQLGDSVDVAGHEGDHPDAELVADVAHRVGVEQDAVTVGPAFSANDATLFVRPSR